MLLDLRPANLMQQELPLDDNVVDSGANRLIQALNAMNQRFGRSAVTLASAGLAREERKWTMKQERRTPGYTTD